MHGVFLLPGRGLHFLETGSHDDLDVLAAQTPRGAAAVHGGVAAAQYDDPFADLLDMPERHAGEPIDADMDIGRRLDAAGQIQIAPARCARADEDGVIIFSQHGF